MGNGNVVVDNSSISSSQPGPPTVESPAGSDRAYGLQVGPQAPLKSDRPKICGAMSQQRGHSGHESAPQKFVRLVGCRDPKAKT